MDGLVFGEFFEHLTTEMRRAVNQEMGDTLSLESLDKERRRRDDDRRRPRPEDEEEFLRLHDGNYLKAKEAEASAPSEEKRTEV